MIHYGNLKLVASRASAFFTISSLDSILLDPLFAGEALDVEEPLNALQRLSHEFRVLSLLFYVVQLDLILATFLLLTLMKALSGRFDSFF